MVAQVTLQQNVNAIPKFKKEFGNGVTSQYEKGATLNKCTIKI